MKFINEETALFPILRYYFKTQKEVAQIINRSQNYVAQRMSRTSGKTFTANEKDLLIKAIRDHGDCLEVSERNRQIIFSDRFNPEEKNKLLFIHISRLTARVEG